MNAIYCQNKFTKTLNLPYQLGIYLAVNAVSDSCAVVDGSDCVMPKINFLAGNHDIYSTLLSPDGGHRIICTMSQPLSSQHNPEKRLSAIISSMANSGRFGVIMVTGLPFLKLAGMDYEGIVASIKSSVPMVDIPPKSLEVDWLEGYALALDALARALPLRKVKKKKHSVGLVGYLMDRNERDHTSNIRELKHLLKLCRLELICVFPSGGSFKELSRVLEAEVIVSMPYGRRAAKRIADRSGAILVETGLPIGLNGTRRWLESVCSAAAMKGELPRTVKELEREVAVEISPALGMLAHKNIAYIGDPYLFSAISTFASELCMRTAVAFIDSFNRPLDIHTTQLPGELLFSPDIEQASAVIRSMDDHLKPNIVVGNSFAVTEGLSNDLPFVAIGFPSYGHHCFNDEPFFGFAGVRTLTSRLLNSLVSCNSMQEYRKSQ